VIPTESGLAVRHGDAGNFVAGCPSESRGIAYDSFRWPPTEDGQEFVEFPS